MINDLRNLAHELRREADELSPERDIDYENTPEDECNDELADARREIAARLELILKRYMLDTAERVTNAVGVPGGDTTWGVADPHRITLGVANDWTELRLPTDLAQARQLRDFLVAALLPHEHDEGL